MGSFCPVCRASGVRLIVLLPWACSEHPSPTYRRIPGPLRHSDMVYAPTRHGDIEETKMGHNRSVCTNDVSISCVSPLAQFPRSPPSFYHTLPSIHTCTPSDRY